MKYITNKMAAIFIASIFTLSGLSVAYAAWTDTITISGSISTGEVKWVWDYSAFYVTDPFAPPPIIPDDPNKRDWNVNPDIGFLDSPIAYRVDKNVGWGTYTEVDDHTCQIELNDAYPGYYNHFGVGAHYIGDIPAKIDCVIYTFEDGTEIKKVFAPYEIVGFDFNNDSYDDIQIQWNNAFGDQMHYCATPDMSFKICVLQKAPLQSALIFKIKLVCIQWNEYPSGP